MAFKIYLCRRFRSVGAFEYAADFSQASSQLVVRFERNFHSDDDDEGWQPVPFQVADCKHNRREAERMIAEYFR